VTTYRTFHFGPDTEHDLAQISELAAAHPEELVLEEMRVIALGKTREVALLLEQLPPELHQYSTFGSHYSGLPSPKPQTQQVQAWQKEKFDRVYELFSDVRALWHESKSWRRFLEGAAGPHDPDRAQLMEYRAHRFERGPRDKQQVDLISYSP
jgi:hypothetical protein